MPSHLSGTSRELAVEIMRCPILAACLEESGYRLACYDAAVGPGGPYQGRWVPEPWVGHLTEAPLLFVSSSAAGGGDPLTDPGELSVGSQDQELLDWADGGFDEGQAPGIAEGVHLKDSRGVPGKPVRYWQWAKARAQEVLPQPVVPGVGYALTEVVHCSSTGEQQVRSALRTCATLYLERVLTASPARVVVLVGSIARYAFQEYLHLEAPDRLVGPVGVAGRDRLVVAVRHPNSRGGVKSFGGQLTAAQLARVQEALAAPAA
ncbi:MAG TPA: hypothetical protein VMV09_05420 [Candidatus Saccharimonadales bacterium]|nr:hypothetical protein [Candidatus Saccharimonadales bacterium]